MRNKIVGLVLVLAFALPVLTHYGGASISQGSGTPIETNTPLTLPKGTAVIFSRILRWSSRVSIWK